MRGTITLTVNGEVRTATTAPGRFLLDVLREDLRNAGAMQRCGEGRCGGCVVLLNGQRVLACETPLERAENGEIKVGAVS